MEELKLVRWLLKKGANPNVISPSGDTPLSFAVARSSVKIIKLMINANKRQNRDLSTGELVHRAVWRYGKEKDPVILKTLILAGAPVDDILWDKPPAYATKAYFTRGTPLHDACQDGYTTIADMLITNGADPHKQKKKYRVATGETPYEIAVKIGNTDMLEMMQRHLSRPVPLSTFGCVTSVSSSDRE